MIFMDFAINLRIAAAFPLPRLIPFEGVETKLKGFITRSWFYVIWLYPGSKKL